MNKVIFILATICIYSCTAKLSKMGLQTGEQISQNCIKARGGEENLKAVKTITIITEAQMGGGTVLKTERNIIAPDKLIEKMESPRGTLTIIINGEKSAVIPSQIALPEGDIKYFKEEATIFPELYSIKLGHKLEYLGTEIVNNRKMNKVKVLYANGKEKINFYDDETKLLSKVIDNTGIVYCYDDYRVVKGIKFPYSNKTVRGQDTISSIKVKEITVNPVFEEKMFKID
jgi:zinc protease